MSVQIKGVGTIGGIDQGLNVVGVTTASNFKTGTSNVHSTGYECTNVNATGVITATSFVGSGSGLTGLNSDLVNDTSPQLGGNLDTNSHEISLDTSHAVNFGDSNELQIKYHGGIGYIDFNGSNNLQTKIPPNKYYQLQNRTTGDNLIEAQAGGALSLWHAGSKKFETTNTGATLTGNLKFAQSGNGIDFSVGAAGASQSNVLDEYEEGVWTPALTDASSGGGAYVNPPSNMNARYIKIGRLVHLHFGVHAIGGTAAVANFNTSNPIYITGLPFPCLAQHSKHFVSMGYMPTVIEKNVFASLSQYNTWMDFQYHGHNTSTGAGYQVRWNMIHVSSNAGYGNIAFDLMYETYP